MSTLETQSALDQRAALFAALGDGTRLGLIAKLSGGQPQSISRLAEGTALTRQAITKHLKVLEGAGIVRGIKSGRENLFEFQAQPLRELERYLDTVARQWEDTLGRLKAFVEQG